MAEALAEFEKSLEGDSSLEDIIGLLEELLQVRQDEIAFEEWSKYVDSFYSCLKKAVDSDDEAKCNLEFYEQLRYFHFQHELKKINPRLYRAYRNYKGFTKPQVIKYLICSGRLSLRLKDYEQAYQRFREALEEGDRGTQSCIRLFLSLIRLARERPPEAQKCLRKDEALLNRMLPELPQGLANKFEEVGEQLSHA